MLLAPGILHIGTVSSASGTQQEIGNKASGPKLPSTVEYPVIHAKYTTAFELEGGREEGGREGGREGGGEGGKEGGREGGREGGEGGRESEVILLKLS